MLYSRACEGRVKDEVHISQDARLSRPLKMAVLLLSVHPLLNQSRPASLTGLSNSLNYRVQSVTTCVAPAARCPRSLIKILSMKIFKRIIDINHFHVFNYF